MKQAFHFFKTHMPPSRKADYHLGCLDSAVFIDFNCMEDQLIYLARISFDGYGCCKLDHHAKPLELADSQKFVEEIDKEYLDQAVISSLVMKIIQINKDQIWFDAIQEYGLI